MKNIHNILSDAFVDAAMDESHFSIELVRENVRTLQISLKRKDSNEILRIDISHEQDGYIANVSIVDNSLTEYTRRDCVRFINSLYNQEQFYV